MKTLGEKTFDLLEATGLNWTVTKESLVSQDGKPTNSYGLFRKDNGNHLYTVGKRYEVYQNYQLAEALITATESIDLTLSRGGMLSGGAKVYLQAELPQEYIGKSGVKRHITGLNSFDGACIGFGSSNTVVVCQNTWFMAYGELSKFRHTLTADEKIKTFIEGLRTAMQLEGELVTKCKIMADLPMRDEIFAKVLAKCFNVDIDEKMGDVSTRTKNKMTVVADAIATEVALEGATLWGLFNGITRYTNHLAVKPENRDEYIMTGGGYDTNKVAFDTIMAWVSENTEELVTV